MERRDPSMPDLLNKSEVTLELAVPRELSGLIDVANSGDEDHKKSIYSLLG